MSYESFSSMPPEEERHFAVFEEFTQQNVKRANVVGLAAAIGFGVLVIGIVAAYWGTAPKAKFDEAAEESAAAAPAPTPTPAPAPAPAPTEPAPAAAPATDTAAPAAAPAAEAPAPAAADKPAGASKAPPPH